MKVKTAGIAALLLLSLAIPTLPAAGATCEYWVSPDGSDANSGTNLSPWLTLRHAADSIPDQGCTVLFAPGVYSGSQKIKRRFVTSAVFRSSTPHAAIFQANSSVINIDGSTNVTFEGFEVRHAGPGSTGYVMIVDMEAGLWSENVTIKNNIIHDSYDDDLLKIHNGVRGATVEGNVFYNQGPSEQHMDVNGVTDVVIQDNIFFNSFAASGRTDTKNTKHYIVIKDSNGLGDGLLGAHRITVQRNIFANWEGGVEAFVQVGNDGEAYHEAQTVRVQNNLFLGNSANKIGAPFGVAGAKDVTFNNNTIVGDLPTSSAAFRIVAKGANPKNQNIAFYNNIWSDPTGTLGEEPGDTIGAFAAGPRGDTIGLVLNTNLYWNGGKAIPPGEPISPQDDPGAVFANPGINPNQGGMVLPVWNGVRFPSGNTTNRQEFVRLVNSYGVPTQSVAGAARLDQAPSNDILGNPRSMTPSLGAVEVTDAGLDTPACPAAVIPPKGFTDLGGLSATARDSIDCIAFYGITQGVSPTLFAPYTQVPRWQMALFLIREAQTAGVNMPDGSDQSFTDLGGLSSEAQKAINQLAQLQITKGVAPGRYDPYSPVPRWQMAIFLVRTVSVGGETLPSGADQGFKDLGGLSSEAQKAINQLAQLQITKGVAPGRYDPYSPVPRWQMAIFLARTLDTVGVTPG